MSFSWIFQFRFTVSAEGVIRANMTAKFIAVQLPLI